MIKEETDHLSKIAAASILIAIAVMGLKYLAYWTTGSVALYSDALESLVNAATAIAALIAIRISSRPADRHHQFGHHKAEYLSAVLEGALIVLAAILILHEAWGAIAAPRVLTSTALGLSLLAVASAINAAWAWFLMRFGRRLRSPALVADGRHLVTDVATSAGVIVGLTLAKLTGWHLLDPLLAAGVAIYILYAGWRLTSESVSGLMDEAVAGHVSGRIRQLIAENATGALEAHDLRTRSAGRATFVEFHLVVPGSMSVSEAHRICDRLEEAISEEIRGADVLIHVEPEREAQHRGIVLG